MKKSLILAAGSMAALISAGNADQLFADDVIVQGSLAVGLDSVNNESFGFDTIRLKENNTRIKFEDTSATGGFASNDWQLTANDSASGGLNKFSIDDIDGGKTPFTLEAGAPTNSLYVSSGGKLGMGTDAPVLKLHMDDGNTPAMRLEQNASGGFTPQTWDVAGNEANFFVRDVTGGSRLPFRIRPGAPTSSIDISASGNVGVGTANPTSSLHVSRADGTAAVTVEEQSGTTAARSLLNLTNNGIGIIKMLNSQALGDAGGGGWRVVSKDGLTFDIRPEILTLPGRVEFRLQRGGNLTLLGSANATAFNTTSDMNLKKDIVSVKSRDILDKVMEMPIAEWSFITGDDGVRHIGPMAQDFQKQFGLGPSDKTINVMDSAGVALAAIQGLTEILNEREAEIKDLSDQMKELREEMKLLRKEQAVSEPSF